MNYKEAIINSMNELAKDENRIFLGYNVCFGSEAYGTLKNISLKQRLETPLAENLMIGLASGMSLEGYKPVVFFERHDFILNALDGIVNHLDKIPDMSENQYSMPVIIRATIGSRSPLNPGVQHTQDFTNAFKELINFPVYYPKTPKDILESYKIAKDSKSPIMIIEKRDLYNTI